MAMCNPGIKINVYDINGAAISYVYPGEGIIVVVHGSCCCPWPNCNGLYLTLTTYLNGEEIQSLEISTFNGPYQTELAVPTSAQPGDIFTIEVTHKGNIVCAPAKEKLQLNVMSKKNIPPSPSKLNLGAVATGVAVAAAAGVGGYTLYYLYKRGYLHRAYHRLAPAAKSTASKISELTKKAAQSAKRALS